MMYKERLNPETGEVETEVVDFTEDDEGSILDERLPHRFGNRKTRRKMQSQIKKLGIK